MALICGVPARRTRSIASEATTQATTQAASTRSQSDEDEEFSATAAPALPSIDLRALVPERWGARAEVSLRYQMNEKEAGAGGYGRVFMAEDLEVPGRRVAVKQILATTDRKRLAYDNEVVMLKRLDHPNVARILETRANGSLLSIVMELCEGGDVFQRITTKGPLSEDLGREVTEQVVVALHYAHGQGVAHCDIKPENICFVSNDPNDSHVKVIDWGGAVDLEGGANPVGVGSTAYLPPEIRGRMAAGPLKVSGAVAADLWSLGITIYVALSGMPPFWGSLEQQLQCMRSERYPLNDQLWKGVSAEAKDFVKSLLRAQPEQRLPLDKALGHPWLSQSRRARAESCMTRRVLADLQVSSRSPHFESVFAVSVIKQLNHGKLQDLRKVFADLDTNRDGTLDRDEFREGFGRVFGTNSEKVVGLEDLFTRLDLNGSGSIDYSEFCAAGLGERLTAEEGAMWAAFKDFDVNDKVKQELASGTKQSELSSEESPLEEWLAQMRIKESSWRRSGVAEAPRGDDVATAVPRRRSLVSMACGIVLRLTGRGTQEVDAAEAPRQRRRRQPRGALLLSPVSFHAYGHMGGNF